MELIPALVPAPILTPPRPRGAAIRRYAVGGAGAAPAGGVTTHSREASGHRRKPPPAAASFNSKVMQTAQACLHGTLRSLCEELAGNGRPLTMGMATTRRSRKGHWRRNPPILNCPAR